MVRRRSPPPPAGRGPDILATWPQAAAAVAVRRDPRYAIEISAPFGLDDLLDGVWR
jgi:hypothetical protein